MQVWGREGGCVVPPSLPPVPPDDISVVGVCLDGVRCSHRIGNGTLTWVCLMW